MNKINNSEACQGNEYANKNQTIKVDLPTSLINQLEEIFPSVNSKTFKKILFMIFLINKGKWNSLTKRYENYYELSIKSLKTYLSLNSKLSPIIKTLLDSNIIAKMGGYTTRVNYQKYRMITPFNFQKNNEEFTTLFLTSEDGAYVRKYIADGYIIKYNSTTSIPKKQSADVNNNDAYYQGVIEELIKENNKLKKQVEQLQNIKKEELSTATIEEYLQDDRDLIEEEIEIITESEPIVVEDKSKLRDRPYDRNTDYYRVISAYYSKTNDYDKEGLLCYAQRFRSLDKAILVEELNKVVVYEEYLKEYFKNYQKK